MAVYFISDLHLEPQQEAITQGFLQFVNALQDAEQLYILGDFFEVWIGDDMSTPYTNLITEALRALSQRGCELYFLHGNRDFLIREEWAKATGCTLLPEYHVIQLGDRQALLCHGDAECIDDVEYMAARKVLRSDEWQNDFLSKTIEQRIEVARQLRSESQSNQQVKSYDIMDVNQGAIDTLMDQYNLNLLIHGHTHRPDHHQWSYKGQPRDRYVLGDWGQQGWYIKWSSEKEIETVSFDLTSISPT